MNELIQNILVYCLPVLFAITLHEAAHAYVAKHFGDATAYLQGRVSINPTKHIDPIGTIVIPLSMYLVTSGSMLFGYAKPVPVNFGRLRNPRQHGILVALAGPMANLIMALFWKILFITTPINDPFFIKMAEGGIIINLVLFAFNLFPLPPLDGGRVLTNLLPYRYAYKFAQIENYGFFILLGLMFAGLLKFWLYPVMTLADQFISLLLLPLSFLIY
jgi:Zn-dependent protease